LIGLGVVNEGGGREGGFEKTEREQQEEEEQQQEEEGRRVVLCLSMRRKRKGLLGFVWPMLFEWLLTWLLLLLFSFGVIILFLYLNY
jgi:hypothetical protein